MPAARLRHITVRPSQAYVVVEGAADGFFGDFEPLAVDAVDGDFGGAELNAHGRLRVAVELGAVRHVQPRLQDRGGGGKVRKR